MRAPRVKPSVVTLCSKKNDVMAKMALPEDDEQILAEGHQVYLPTDDELREELERERDERTLRLSSPPVSA